VNQQADMVKKKVKGAWIIHHANKLQGVYGSTEFEKVELAGKCGVLLSAISADDGTELSTAKLHALAKASNIKPSIELESILKELQKQGLVEIGSKGIGVLGVTPSATLGHTAKVFDELGPSPFERASLTTAEFLSRLPAKEGEIAEFVGDEEKLSSQEIKDLLNLATDTRLIDRQGIQSDAVYYNGNLFRVENEKKVAAILESLSIPDRLKMQEVESLLSAKGCLEYNDIIAILGDPLFKKLQVIGLYDLSEVSNTAEIVGYVTKPGAFGKYGDTIARDALDLAKAFVASLTYGMTRSAYMRGKITMLNALLTALVSGRAVGPSTAAGEDYKVLELRGVVEVIPHGDGRFMLRLLKKEVGEQALKILTSGDASEESLPNFPGSSVMKYRGPERTRVDVKLEVQDAKAAESLIRDLRTGGLG